MEGGTFLGIGWLWWLIGTFGIAGTVALVALAPAAIPMVVQTIVRVVGYLLSTRWGCALLAALVAYAVADIARSRMDHAAFEKEKQAFEQAQVARDTRIAQETRDEVWKEIANQTAMNKETDRHVEEFKDALPAVPHAEGNPFAISPADAARLCQISGQTECGNRPAARSVPAPRKRSAVPANHGFRLPNLISRGHS
jgi:hypothetical protein